MATKKTPSKKAPAKEISISQPKVKAASRSRNYVMNSIDPFTSGAVVNSGQPDFSKETGRRGSEVLGLITGPATTNIFNVYVARKRSRYAVLTNPYAKRGVDVLTSNVVGTGHRLFSLAPDTDFRRQVEQLWNKWSLKCDTTGQLPFGGFEALAFRSMAEGGDCFVRRRVRRSEDNLPVPLQLQLIEAEQVPLHKNEALSQGQRVIAGVQFDPLGRPTAYHMYSSHPGDYISFTADANAANTIQVPASEVLHLHDVKRPQDVRGMPSLAMMLIRLSDLDRYMDAEMVRKKACTLIGGYVRRPADDVGGMPFAIGNNTEDDQEVIIDPLEPGAFPVLPYGYDVTFSDPSDVGANFEKFLKHQLMSVASSINVLYEQVTGDLSGVNDRTLRAAMLEFKRLARMMQEHIVVHQFCDPVFEWFFELAIISGALQIPAGMDIEDAKKRKWVADPWEHLNPNQEIAAEKDEIRAGLKSRSQAIVERGMIPEELDDEIDRDKQRQKELGLVFDTDAEAVSRSGVQHQDAFEDSPEQTPTETPEGDDQ